MNNVQTTLSQFAHRPLRIRVRFPDALRSLVGFIEDDEDVDTFESEVKRMIELSGMVTPQYDAVALESWD